MYKKFKLKNGIRVVFEQIPYVKSVALGIWIKTGSMNEMPDNNGISHFIEHMLFKGTEKRSASVIAESFDNIGGQINAFTGKECTCYYAKTLNEHVDLVIDILSDMLFHSTFTKKDINVERKVIIEEIGMYEDSPEELVHDVLSETVWAGSTIGYPILGTIKSLKGINRNKLLDYIVKNYTPDNTVIAVAGNLDDKRLVEMLEENFGEWLPETNVIRDINTVEFKPDISIREKETEQVHLCIGFEGIKNGDDKLYPLLAVNNIFGGSMSSRLFQKIREKKGFAYSIYSYPTTYNDAGLLAIYAGMKPEHLNKVIDLIHSEVKLLLKNGITPQELEKSKEQLKGNYILGLESTGSRMNSIGKSELLLGYINTPDEILEKINKITMNDIDEIIKNVFKPDSKGISIVGSIKPGFDKKSVM